MSDKRPSIADLLLAIAPSHGTPPTALTGAELTAQHAGYHDFSAIESMVCELRRCRRYGALIQAAPLLLEIVAADLELDGARCVHSGPTCTPQAGHMSCPVWRAIQRRTTALTKIQP